MWRESMNRVIPHYKIVSSTKDFPEWSVKILSGDFEGVTYTVDKLGIPENVQDDDTPISVKLEYTVDEGFVPEEYQIRFTQTVGWILEDIIE